MLARMGDTMIDTAHGTITTRDLTPASAEARLVLGHGAGADLGHAHMEAIAAALAVAGIATLRFNFPFMEQGKHRTDSLAVCLDTIAAVLDAAPGDLPRYLGGHSFGGRMASHHAASADNLNLCGMIYFSFPLHPSGKPATKRADHLKDISLPQLFLSGTRDKLAEPELLTDVTDSLPQATLVWLDTGDHGLKVLKRSRASDEDIYAEAARHALAFTRETSDNAGSAGG